MGKIVDVMYNSIAPSFAALHRHVGTHLKALELDNNISKFGAAKLCFQEAITLQSWAILSSVANIFDKFVNYFKANGAKLGLQYYQAIFSHV